VPVTVGVESLIEHGAEGLLPEEVKSLVTACVLATKDGRGTITDDKATLLAASDKFADLDEPWLAEAFKQAARNPIRVCQPEGSYEWRAEYQPPLGGTDRGPNFLRVMVAMAKRLREIKEKLGW
jgi:hypothetical protein